MSKAQSQQKAFNDPALIAERADLLTDLRGLLPEDSVLKQEEQQRPTERDGLSACRHISLLLVLPHTLDEVQRLCHSRGVPAFALGAGTGEPARDW